MSSLRITEFAGPIVTGAGTVQIPGTPLAHQVVTIGSQADSAALNAATRMVRLYAESACCVTWGLPEQTATTGMMLLAADAVEYIGIVQGHEISCIAAA